MQVRLKGYRFETSATLCQLGWIDALYTQNFEILKSLEQTQESKKIKITLEIFVKILNGLNFGKRCL
jgi:c-di-AMP phosphodiesterase-like protein